MPNKTEGMSDACGDDIGRADADAGDEEEDRSRVWGKEPEPSDGGTGDGEVPVLIVATE